MLCYHCLNAALRSEIGISASDTMGNTCRSLNAALRSEIGIKGKTIKVSDITTFQCRVTQRNRNQADVFRIIKGFKVSMPRYAAK